MSTFTAIMQQRINALQNRIRYLQEHNYNLKKITRYLHESNMGGGGGGGSMGGGGGSGSGDLKVSDKPNFANETLGQNQGGGYGGGYGDQLPWWHTPNLGPIQYDTPPYMWMDGPPGSGIIRFAYLPDGGDRLRAIAEFNLNGQIVQRVYSWNSEQNMWFIVPNA
jgi:hypothetical protein